jgi:hypothetical protein
MYPGSLEPCDLVDFLIQLGFENPSDSTVILATWSLHRRLVDHKQLELKPNMWDGFSHLILTC